MAGQYRQPLLNDTPFDDAAYQLALEWSEAGGAAFDLVVFTETWETSRADLTSYKAIFANAQRRGWENPQVLRPYPEKEKTGFYMTGEGLMENYMSGSGNAKELRLVKSPLGSPFMPVPAMLTVITGGGWWNSAILTARPNTMLSLMKSCTDRVVTFPSARPRWYGGSAAVWQNRFLLILMSLLHLNALPVPR